MPVEDIAGSNHPSAIDDEMLPLVNTQYARIAGVYKQIKLRRKPGASVRLLFV